MNQQDCQSVCLNSKLLLNIDLKEQKDNYRLPKPLSNIFEEGLNLGTTWEDASGQKKRLNHSKAF